MQEVSGHDMSTFSNLIQERFALKASELIAALESAETIPHASTRGSIRESTISNSIRQFLPPALSACSGFVTDVYGTITPQLDIVLYRREGLAPFLLEGSTALIPFETFGLAIEVKSTLTTDHLNKQVTAQIEALSRLRDTALIPGNGSNSAVFSRLSLTIPRLCIVAYRSDVAIPTMESFIETNPPVQAITVISGDHKSYLVKGNPVDTGGTDLDRVIKFWSLIFYISLAVQNRSCLSPEQEFSLNAERNRVRPDLPQEVFKQLIFTPSLAAYLSPPVPGGSVAKA